MLKRTKIINIAMNYITSDESTFMTPEGKQQSVGAVDFENPALESSVRTNESWFLGVDSEMKRDFFFFF